MPATATTQAVAALATAPARGVLAIVGHAGTGRHDALLAGLERALGATDAPDSTTVWCPDSATAARLHLAALRRRPGWRLDLRVAGAPGEPGLESRDRAPGGRRLTVIAELQRLPRELRYQLLDQSWGDRLLVTVDPGGEPRVVGGSLHHRAEAGAGPHARRPAAAGAPAVGGGRAAGGPARDRARSGATAAISIRAA